MCALDRGCAGTSREAAAEVAKVEARRPLRAEQRSERSLPALPYRCSRWASCPCLIHGAPPTALPWLRILSCPSMFLTSVRDGSLLCSSPIYAVVSAHPQPPTSSVQDRRGHHEHWKRDDHYLLLAAGCRRTRRRLASAVRGAMARNS